MKLPAASLVIAYAIFFACLAATWADLPARIASHFDVAGRPNGWMARGPYLIFTVGMALGLPAFMIAITLVTGRLGRGINIPNRDYWLAPERRTATIQVVMRYVVALAALVVLLVTAIHVLIVQANRKPAALHLSPATWPVLGGFGAAIVIWLIMLHRRFARVT